MRYRYRVRLFYSVLFLVVGLIIGYYAAGYDLGKLQDLDFVKMSLDTGKNYAVNIGIILPKSEYAIKDAVNLAIMELNAAGEKKINVDYEYAECSEKGVKSAMSRLKNANAVYGIFCNETVKTAVNIADENKMLLISPSLSRDLTNSLNTGLIKVKLYNNLEQNTYRLNLAYNKFYNRTPDIYDAISYDAINLIDLMLKDIKIENYKGVLGIINIEKKNNSYIIVLEY